MNFLRYTLYICIFSALCSGLVLWVLGTHNGTHIVLDRSDSSDAIHTYEENAQNSGLIRIAFVGDLMFDRGIRQVSARLGYGVFTQALIALAEDVDILVGNLEGPITTHASKSIMTSVEDGRDHFTFTFAPEVADVLASSGVQVVSLANNHALDFGSEGVMQTRRALIGAGIAYFGDPLERDQHVHTFLHEGITVSLIGFNQFGAPNEEDALRAIERTREASDLVAVFPHWGEEYTTTVTSEQRRLARRFIDAGADLVVGAHPHVIQPTEVYQGKTIYYSLGNAVFDQWFSPEVSCGLALVVTYDAGSEVVSEMRFEERFMWSTSRGINIVERCPS